MNLGAQTYFALGLFRQSIKTYDEVLKIDPKNSCWFRREIVYFYLKHADDSVISFNLNKAIHPRIKEGFATSSYDHVEFMKGYPEYKSLAIMHSKLAKGNDKPPKMPAKGYDVLKVTSKLGAWIQVDSPGFMPHKRHYRMFGLAVLQVAQTLRMHVASIKKTGRGVEVPDSYTSHSDGIKVKTAKPNHHEFAWRDLFDIIIRWRQLSAPGDPIWWTDQLTQKEYSERQGMTTYMLNGQGVNVRYGPYVNMALNATRDQLLAVGFLPQSGSDMIKVTDPKLRRVIEDAKHVSDLHRGVGDRSFYALMPCYSTLEPGRVMNGTLIRLDKAVNDGWDFGICTSTSYRRYIDYEEELDAAFQRVVRALVNAENLNDSNRREAVEKHTLELFFYWIQFTPITRGTSASGYAAILACILAMGEQIDNAVPKGKQLDWEGILTSDPKAFVARVVPWISSRSKTDIPSTWLDGAPGYRLIEIFDTPRKMWAAINGDEKEVQIGTA
jgi:hypothetical protein